MFSLFESNSIKNLIENWNRKFPIDRWYRKKYNIAFNSSIHRQINIIDIYFEFWEFISMQQQSKDNKKQEYIKGKNSFMKDINFSSKDIDNLFDELDIDNMD